MVAIPVATAALGCFIRYFTAKIRSVTIGPEVFVFWPELLLAAVFNLLTAASDLANRKLSAEEAGDSFLAIMSAGLVLLLALWIVSFMAAIPRTAPWRRVVWTYGVPHLSAIGALELSLLLALGAKA
ncbi:hypothetical protein NCC78_08170 [Micromonospora phytophila]|uniref:hypothetical protein n=1 Tax=Micromonospora phytophila TaxID=709888 RepID=UPI00203097BF|nr:hypothetical protein [Micromonospora phytophila]MCM0674662.1 hypothetical protein [Micromonospora phytophila]